MFQRDLTRGLLWSAACINPPNRKEDGMRHKTGEILSCRKIARHVSQGRTVAHTHRNSRDGGGKTQTKGLFTVRELREGSLLHRAHTVTCVYSRRLAVPLRMLSFPSHLLRCCRTAACTGTRLVFDFRSKVNKDKAWDFGSCCFVSYSKHHKAGGNERR